MFIQLSAFMGQGKREKLVTIQVSHIVTYSLSADEMTTVVLLSTGEELHVTETPAGVADAIEEACESVARAHAILAHKMR